jgi:hypothetical protein
VSFRSPRKKIAADADVKYSVPPPHCAKAKLPEVVTVAVPAVIVHVPAPMLWIHTLSPAPNKLLLTVIVVAPAAFITTRLPPSEASKT